MGIGIIGKCNFRRTRWVVIFLLLAAMGSGTAANPVINEFVASNGSTIADEEGDFEDWVEILNRGEEAVSLAGFHLSDDEENPFRWAFPEVTIAPGEFLLVWASGKDRTDPAGPLHTNFSIAASGEPLILSGPGGEVIDVAGPVSLPRDTSYGRKPDGTGEWHYFDSPTPAAPNTTTGHAERLPPPLVSHRSGFYTDPFTLRLASPDPDAEIIYTIDGSEPRIEALDGRTYHHKKAYPQGGGDPPTPLLERELKSHLYTAPLSIESRADAPNDLSLITTTFLPVSMYAPNSPVFKGTTVRARLVREGALPGEVVTRTYFVDPEGRERYSLPVIAITTPEDHLFDYERGIYTAGAIHDEWRAENPDAPPNGGNPGNYFMRGREWEHPAHFELFEPGGNEGVAQDMGLRLHGGWTRSFPQKSLRLYARTGLSGSESLDHPLIPGLKGRQTGEPVDSFHRFILRNGGNDYHMTRIRDPLNQELLRPLGLDQQGYRPAVHFINGEYWGLCAIRERIDRYFIANHHGIDPGDVVIINSHDDTGMYALEEGRPEDREDWMALHEYIGANDMADPDHYGFVADRIDMENFIQYHAAQIYIKNSDWPGNNQRFWRKAHPDRSPAAPPTHDGRWRWIVFDLDMGFGDHDGLDVTHNTLVHATEEDSDFYSNPGWSTMILRRLLQNPEFRTAFINTMAAQINTVFHPGRVDGMVDRLYGEIAPQIAEHAARWTDYWDYSPQSYKEFGALRPDIVRDHVMNHFDLPGTVEITVEVSGPEAGSVRLGGLRVNADTPGIGNEGKPFPWTGTWFRGVDLEIEAIPAPGYRFVEWEGLPDKHQRRSVVHLEDNLRLEARFEEEPTPSLLHYWNFNDADAPTSPRYTIGGAALTLLPGPETAFEADTGNGFRGENSRLADPAGPHLRVNDPIGTTLTLSLPTSGYTEPVLTWESRRSGQGAGVQVVEYSPDGEAFHPFTELEIPNGDPLVHRMDFSEVPAASDNGSFQVRVRFEAGSGGESGNNRFDNVTLEALPMEGTNAPPQLLGAIGLREAAAGGDALLLPPEDHFVDPDGDNLDYTLTSSNPTVAEASVDAGNLRITPLVQGDTRITISAADPHHPPITTTFRVLVHPGAASLVDGPHRFHHWSPGEPEGSFPPSMIFLQSEVTDPGAGEPLLHPYHIPPGEWHEEDLANIGFPYAATRRTRLNALGGEGISFINTGRGRDLGGALLAIDTRNVEEAFIGWTAGTVLRNDRLYALRLQYRIGLEEPFKDLLLHGIPMEYLAAGDGDTRHFGPVPLPTELLGHEYVQLLWRYHHVDGSSGPRAEIRLDNIAVTTGGVVDSWLLH